jgi:6-phosphogluconolactonase
MSQTRGRAQVRLYPTPEAVAEAAARSVATIATAATASSGRFTISLSGGSTPRLLYSTLAREYHDSMPWAKVHLFWGDDRFVPHDDPDSNYRMVKEALLDHVPVQQISVHPMPVFFDDPAQAAADYEATLKSYWAGGLPRFDLMLQGLGTDGHTASLFPHSQAIHDHQRWVLAISEPTADPPRRLTVTLPIINNAARVYFIVTGPEKAGIVRRVLAQELATDACPAAGVQPEHGEVTWWLDEAAASDLSPGTVATHRG